MINQEETELIKLFFKIKQLSILINLNKPNLYIRKLSRLSGMTYGHLVNVLKLYEKAGIIETTKKLKRKEIKITEKGQKLLKLVEEILELK